MTNGERLRQMTDEELAKWVCRQTLCARCIFYQDCDVYDGEANGYNKWLKKESEEEE